jgi:hypothetical protein
LRFDGDFLFLTNACLVQVEDLEEHLGVSSFSCGGVEECFPESCFVERAYCLPEGFGVDGALLGENCVGGCEGGGLGCFCGWWTSSRWRFPRMDGIFSFSDLM